MNETSKNKPENGKPRYGKGSNFVGKKGRSGPPSKNRNAMRHGLKGGKLPKGAQYIENRVNSLRRQLENAIIEMKSAVGILDAANINSAMKWERHGLLAQHWLRHEVEKLSPTERLKFSEAIARASDSRDKAIRALGLDRDENESIIDTLYSRIPEDNGKDEA